MKKLFMILAVLLTLAASNNLFPQVAQQVTLNGNNIASFFINTGVFDQDRLHTNTPGFEWPKGSGKCAIFTAGLCIAGGIDGQYAQSMASYTGEFLPGFILAGVPYTNANFKIYKISRGDNSQNNPDYANWYLMIPYGAPYIDVNNNGMYDPGVDSIGIRNAAQVLFACITDGFPGTHTIGEGFGGGIVYPSLMSQIAWTAWCYDKSYLSDIQFMKWVIVNKGNNRWDSTYFSIVCDPDLGDANDDYIGCDTSRKLGFCYNADNNDPQYGANPPSSGMIFHKSPKGMTSFNFFTNTGSTPPPCESDPNGEPIPAYHMMQGLKKDRSNFMNPLTVPPVPTKFVYTGDPETNTGWTEYKGSVQNCGGNNGTIISVNPPGDRRFIFSSGALNYSVNQGDTVIIYASQLIARGTSNLNSVTALKSLANTAWDFYNSGFTVGIKTISEKIPADFYLYQNYPNPFNPVTKIKFDIPSLSFPNASIGNPVQLKVFDITGREVAVLVNEQLRPGTYEVTFDGSNYPSGTYFYRLQTGDYSETKKMILLK
jgi:hypothetical protein